MLPVTLLASPLDFMDRGQSIWIISNGESWTNMTTTNLIDHAGNNQTSIVTETSHRNTVDIKLLVGLPVGFWFFWLWCGGLLNESNSCKRRTARTIARIQNPEGAKAEREAGRWFWSWLWRGSPSNSEQKTQTEVYMLTNSAAISSDNKLVVSFSEDRTVRFWDLETKLAIRTLDFTTPLRSVDFSRCGKYIETDRGMLDMSWVSPSTSNQIDGLSLFFVSGDFIKRGEEDIIWLPQEYRATCVATHNNTVVLGHEMGSVSFFDFDAQKER
ncbi:vegetative incompatibility protein HET-E-1 [Penicillium malachiteum]|nr:vegetative incompatibility protein HET-E-1 [Penicillium malachiteum]